jgi:nitroimidazol reductase NimA-like FMN-containing flavoprotein (pyridoxamine 5'-phosphate oxidase superfamily)
MIKPPTDRTRLRRLPKRGHYDKDTIYGILDAGMIGHIGYVIDGQPFVTPTIYWREGNSVYWHGSWASRMLRQQAAGTPVCLTVSHLDGIVLARSGFHHSVNYRSVMLLGTPEEVEGSAKKLAHMRVFVDRLFPGRWDELRAVSTKELKATKVMRMEIDEASAKIRTGPPADDEQDYELPIWAGVLPLRTVVGAPEACPRLQQGIARPGYLNAFKLG